MTCVVSILLFFLISDFPEESKWLTAEEKAFVKRRLQEDVGDSQEEEKISVKTVLEVLSDCESLALNGICASADHSLSADKVILGGFMYFGLIIPAYGYGMYPLNLLWCMMFLSLILLQRTLRLRSSKASDMAAFSRSFYQFHRGLALSCLQW